MQTPRQAKGNQAPPATLTQELKHPPSCVEVSLSIHRHMSYYLNIEGNKPAHTAVTTVPTVRPVTHSAINGVICLTK